MVRSPIAANSSPFLARLRHSGYLLPSTLTGYLWLKGWQPNLHLPGFACPLRALSGIPCPTCFLTRATCASLIGNFDEALRWHAFGPLLAGALLFWSIDALRTRRWLPRRPGPWPLLFTTAGLLVYWGARIVLTYGLGIPAFPTG